MGYKERILFLNPPLIAAQRYGVLAQSGSAEPPIGLAYLAAAVRKNGFETAILDAQALGIELDDCLKLILDKPPQFLAITLVTMTVRVSSKLAYLLKEKLPDIKIIVGGPHFTSLPKKTLLENPSFDVGVVGEGEITIEELLKALSGRLSLSLVSGIAFRLDKDVILTPPRQRIKDLDSLPMPAFDLLPELKRYYRTTTQSIKCLPTTSLVTSRGCSGHCLFCDRKTFANEVRMHSAEYVTDMMRKLEKDFGVRGIIFEEDNFMLSEERLLNLAQLMHKKKIKIAWSALSRIDTINERKLKIAKSCGCWQILYGIESGSQKILDFYRKDISVPEIKNAVYMAKKCGIYVKGLFILANPLESQDTLKETRSLIMNLPLDDISLTYFTPYPGADIWGQIDRFGKYREDWDNFTCFNLIFTPFGLTEEEISNAQKKILKEFYSRLRIIISYLARLRSFSQFKELYKSWRILSAYSKAQSKGNKLVINADDFGLCEGINKGISKLLLYGTVKGVSIAPTGCAFESAVSIIKSYPEVKIGAHLSLIETKPVLNSKEIPSLVRGEGYFAKNFLIFFIRYLFGRIRKEEINKEFQAQIEKVRNAGIEITHLDSHQHIHMLPGIFNLMVKLAKRYRIPLVRLPAVPLASLYFFNKSKLRRKLCQLILNFLCVFYRPILRRNGIGFYDYSFGFLESGHIAEGDIRRIVSSLKEGEYELICHPAEEDDDLKQLIGHWRYEWNKELEVLGSSAAKELLLCDNKVDKSDS